MSECMWRSSPSPVESYSGASGANEDGEWPLRGVVGEEIRLNGNPRYEMRWDNWHRKDGSNTTWETEDFERIELIRQWKRTQKRIRNTLADVSFDMQVSWPDDAIHKRPTDHRRQAYDEKLAKKLRAGPTSTADWDAEIDRANGRVEEPEIGKTSPKLRVRRVNSASTSRTSVDIPAYPTPSRWGKRSPSTLTRASHDQPFSPVAPPKRRRPRIHRSPSSSTKFIVATPSTVSPKGGTALAPSSAGSLKEPETTRNTLPSIIVSQPTLRRHISSTWNRTAREVMAATVRISPEISDESIPRNIRTFKYMEKGYVFRNDKLRGIFNVSRDVFTVCDCMTCSNASDCPCHDLSQVYDMEGKENIFAYSEGLFTFEVPRGVEVIECNKYCGCGFDCGNRVVQHSRSVGMEIFDTGRYGWGVRALDDIPKGKVLGTYTGVLIRRDEVDKLPEEHQGYLFDLDSTEVCNGKNLGGKYTVDSYECGNWTRFVNHSCSPNMQVYCVVYDTIPYVNMPYVAFVASTNIPAGIELTIDYHPYAEEDKKGKRRARGDCQCGSETCRGWVNV